MVKKYFQKIVKFSKNVVENRPHVMVVLGVILPGTSEVARSAFLFFHCGKKIDVAIW